MQDPYPERIQKETLEAYRRGMTEYYFVNGQDFKHFILNLEAAGEAAWDPQGFDPQKFYPAWAARYFGSEAAAATVESLKALHRASELAGGFANLTIETATALALMKYGVPYLRDYAYVKPALEAAEQSLQLAEQAAALVPAEDRLVFDDQVLFPAKIYLANLRLHAAIAGIIEAEAQILDPLAPSSKKIAAIKKISDLKKQAPQELDRLLELLEQGSGWDKWDGWTRPENFRKYQPPPTRQELQAALRMTLF
jgi:hypothetical protein